MSHVLERLAALAPAATDSYWSERAVSQLRYATEVSRLREGEFDSVIEEAAAGLLAARERDGALTRESVTACEAALAPLGEAAKAITVLCVGHAHIDMNWMWPWEETVSISIETFRTVLKLMRDYPEFTFAQSQASIYHLLEEYAPELLAEIRPLVQAGRWEITASQWVEADKNMPSAESMARHLLYTRRYLAGLFGVPIDRFDLDFEPDTFGHSLNVPEILADGGVRRYYHCRGSDDHDIYRWFAPSGRSILCFREPTWYNAEFTPQWALYAPEFCRKHGIDTMLKVYGVGDHGGGPTRRDIEHIIDYNTWPIFPTFRFGTYREWYDLLDAKGDWPEVRGERNFIFTGCYTSQSRIKRGNLHGEQALHRAEQANALASSIAGLGYPAELFERGWRNVLFNQFHDIIPGSGVIDTREYALGLYQDTAAICTARQSLSLRSLSEMIDTSRWVRDGEPVSGQAEGGGVGFGVTRQRLSQTSRGDGTTRVFVVFNPTLAKRREVTELVLWDWPGDLSRLRVQAADGAELPYQVIGKGTDQYWGHKYVKVLVPVELPPCGYATVAVTDDRSVDNLATFRPAWATRVDKVPSYVLENEHLRVSFDSQTLSIASLVDKASGQELLDRAAGPGQFRLVLEDDSRGMTAWWIGRYLAADSAHTQVRVAEHRVGAELVRQSIRFEARFGVSKLTAEFSLDQGSRRLDLSMECDWHEVGKRGDHVPQLQFHLPVAYHVEDYLYEIPMGEIARPAIDDDVPATTWAMARQAGDAPSLMLLTDATYGYRGAKDALTATLIRSSFEPDPYPEFGIHRGRLAIACVPAGEAAARHDVADAFRHEPVVLSTAAGEGSLPAVSSLVEPVEGRAQLSALKQAEDGSGLLLRLYGEATQATPVRLRFWAAVAEATCVDVNEQPAEGIGAPSVSGREVALELPAGRLVSLLVRIGPG